MKKVLVVFGTRPEAIKLAPVINELKTRDSLETKVCVSGQHREMLKQVLDVFNIQPDYDLFIMQDNQSLFDITINTLDRIKLVLEEFEPDVVLVHGDTSTTFVTSLACFYLQIPVGHIEAGLRTYDINSPFPEEYNRQAVSLIAKYHFAPTELAKDNLIVEKKDEATIFVTGNTAIDALKTTVKKEYQHEYLDWASDSRLILITAHRRENIGKPLENIFIALKNIVHEDKNVKVLYPIHLNPKVREIADRILSGEDRIRIVEPLNVIDFHNILSKSFLVLTDSGGIQEEAPSLNVPVLVVRDKTERPEGQQANTLKVVGTEIHNIEENIRLLLDDSILYSEMANAINPYGDGKASQRIVDIIEKS